MTNPPDLRAFLETVTTFTPVAQAHAIIHAAGSTDGGEIIFPNPDNPKCDEPSWRITLHEITASGITQIDMIQNWIRRANKLARPEVEKDGDITLFPPFPNPRNHGEEITNLRASL